MLKKFKDKILSRIFKEINQINYKSFAWSKLQLKWQNILNNNSNWFGLRITNQLSWLSDPL